MIVELLRQRVRARTTGLLGDLKLFELAFEALSKQSRVTAWVRDVFTEKEANDALERSLRTAEEGLELAQACGADAATLHRLVDYVMGRPVGRPAQEIAGCMVTLYAMAAALKIDADLEFEAEMKRIDKPEIRERCRRRQHEKREALTPPVAPRAGSRAGSVDVTSENVTRLPDDMVEELGRRVWFLRGKTHWEAWSEAELEETLRMPTSAPQTAQEIELAELKARLERTEVQLAGCGVAALDGSVEQEAKVGEYGWSASYMEVLKIRRELEVLRARFETTAPTGDQTDSVRYALQDAFEQQIDRCGGVVPVRSLPDETVSEVFLKALAERGLSVVESISNLSPKTSALEEFCDAQLDRAGSLG